MSNNRVPTRTGKPVKMREVFPVREKSGKIRSENKKKDFMGKV